MKKKKTETAEIVKPDDIETAIVKFKTLTVKITVKNEKVETEVI